MIDDEARDAYRRRARQLANEIAQARQDGADARVACLEEELDALVGQLRSAMHAGHIRRFAGPDERARTAVRKAILRAIASVTALDPGLGEHLRATVVSGLRCVYRPVGPPN